MMPAQQRRSLARVTCVLCAAALLATAPGVAAAQGACGALSAADVATMLGPGPASREIAMGRMCNWRAAQGRRQMQVTLTTLNDEARKNFDDQYAHPGRGPMGETRREAGLGDRALSFTLPYGVNFMVVKGTHYLLLVFANPGNAPTAKDHDALRALAEKIVGKL